jgi:hypothetical protein
MDGIVTLVVLVTVTVGEQVDPKTFCLFLPILSTFIDI